MMVLIYSSSSNAGDEVCCIVINSEHFNHETLRHDTLIHRPLNNIVNIFIFSWRILRRQTSASLATPLEMGAPSYSTLFPSSQQISEPQALQLVEPWPIPQGNPLAPSFPASLPLCFQDCQDFHPLSSQIGPVPRYRSPGSTMHRPYEQEQEHEHGQAYYDLGRWSRGCNNGQCIRGILHQRHASLSQPASPSY